MTLQLADSLLLGEIPWGTIGIAALFGVGFIAAALIIFSQFYRKIGPEKALVRSVQGGLRAVTGSGIFVIPVLHRVDQMDLSVKRIEIARRGEVVDEGVGQAGACI